MKGGTLFSGIGAPELAAPEIDWRWCAETDPFASAVLAARFPHSRNLGDVAKVDWDAVEPVDIVVFGSPCQSFSVAGQRAGLDDPRGDMAFVGLRAVDRLRPRWMVFENVPGLLSIDGGRAFGAFLGELGQCGYGFAYAILDAQHAGVPQRRRRVFVVGYLGDWRGAAAVLFEQSCLRWNPAPRREAGEGASDATGDRASGGFNISGDAESLVTHALDSYSAGRMTEDGTGRGTPIIPVQCNGTNVGWDLPSLRVGNQHITGGFPAIAFDTTQVTSALNRSNPQPDDPCHPLASTAHPPAIATSMSVRRLLPVECEKLQAFPPGWTAIPYRGKPAADGPRYRALGNAMCVNVVCWILRRVALVDAIRNDAASTTSLAIK